MIDRSPLKPGDDIYDVESGRKLGVVRRLYRYWRDRDDGIRDLGSHPDYEYETSPGFIDNTSRQDKLFGTQEEAARRMAKRLERLRGHDD